MLKGGLVVNTSGPAQLYFQVSIFFFNSIYFYFSDLISILWKYFIIYMFLLLLLPFWLISIICVVISSVHLWKKNYYKNSVHNKFLSFFFIH